MTRDAGASGAAGGEAARPPILEQGEHAPPNFLHEGTRGIGDGLSCKAFNDDCYRVNQNFAVKCDVFDFFP